MNAEAYILLYTHGQMYFQFGLLAHLRVSFIYLPVYVLMYTGSATITKEKHRINHAVQQTQNCA